MVGIRSITYFLPMEYQKEILDQILCVSRKWASSFLMIRTQRMAFPPFKQAEDIRKFHEISRMCDMSDIRWFNVPIDPWGTDDRELLFKFAEDVISEFGRSFINILTYKDGKTDFDIVNRSCSLIKRVAGKSDNGKDNFRLGLSANVSPNGPFFPFTYSDGELGFSIALELTQEINRICVEYRNESIDELRSIMVNELRDQIDEICRIANMISDAYGMKFNGFDFSIAPIISEDGSVIPIIQRLGVYNFGTTGTMFATAFLTDMVKSFAQHYKTVGFSGVMYSMLEDLELCMINNQRGVVLDDLIKVSAMCGCGVDMVPVPFDISNNELIAICMEVYAISTRLNKPLGIRILPIPHTRKAQIAYTNLSDDADFIANTRIVDPDVNLISNFGEKFSFLIY